MYIIRKSEKGQYANSLKIDFVQDKLRKLICKIHAHYFKAMSHVQVSVQIIFLVFHNGLNLIFCAFIKLIIKLQSI